MASAKGKGRDVQPQLQPLSGSFEVHPTKRPTSPSKHLLVRFTQDTLNDILSGRQTAGLSFNEDGSPVLRVGLNAHQVAAVAETQAHEVFAHTTGTSSLQSVGFVGNRYTVKQELDKDAQDRVRSRTEAAAAQREGRQIVVLEHEPKRGKGGRPPHGPSNLGRSSNTHSRSSSPVVATASPKVRQPSRLVANDTGPSRRLIPAPTPRAGSPLTIPPAQTTTKEKSPPVRANSDSSNESSNESNGPSIFSHQSSASSRTSVSSADSPPGKDGQPALSVIHETAQTANLAQKPAANVSPRTNSNIQSFSTSSGLKKSGSVPSLKRKTDTAENSDDSQPNAKKSRISSASIPKPTRPEANGRTAGGTRISRPKKAKTFTGDEVTDSTAMDRSMSSSSNASSTAKRKAVEVNVAKPKKKVRRATPEFTSSEDEGNGDLDAEGEEDDVAVVIDHANESTPVRNAIAAVKLEKEQSSALAASLLSGKALPVKVFTITNEKEYKQHQGRFKIMHQDYERRRQKVERQRLAVSSLISGGLVTDAERKLVPSRNEAQEDVVKLLGLAADLQELKRTIWAFAEEHAS